MTCEQLSADYTAYALGILDEAESAAIREHIASHCPNCTAGVSQSLALAGSLSGSVVLSEPPARLRRRILGMVDAQPAGSWWTRVLPWALSGMLAAALLVATLNTRQPDTTVAERNLAKLQQALYILNDPETRDASFGAAQKPSSGKVFVNPSRGIVFVASNLPPLETGKTFELWVIPAAGKPVAAGTFRSEPDSSAVHIWRQPVELTATALAVTIEPEGGSPQPTNQPFIVASL
jgi:anti-sigma-K factor RskA